MIPGLPGLGPLTNRIPDPRGLHVHREAARRSPDSSREYSWERALRQIRVAQLMNSNVTAVDTTASLREAAQAIRSSDSGCLVVLDGGYPVGLASERDMIEILADILVAPGAKDRPIRDFVSSPLACLDEDTSVLEARKLAESANLDQIPVVDSSGRLTGLLIREALAQAELDALAAERDAMERRVNDRSRELNKVNRELQALALQDGLLNIGNRRAMEMDVKSTHMNAVRHQQAYALGLLDVDFFKRYNDHYGHCAGDRALIAVANCIRASIRRGDRVYRYGGEELLVLMPETSLHEALEAVRRLAANLAALNIEHSQSPHRRLTISAGVSAFTAGASVNGGWHSVMEAADAFLYQAKALGRNRVRGSFVNTSAPVARKS